MKPINIEKAKGLKKLKVGKYYLFNGSAKNWVIYVEKNGLFKEKLQGKAVCFGDNGYMNSIDEVLKAFTPYDFNFKYEDINFTAFRVFELNKDEVKAFKTKMTLENL